MEAGRKIYIKGLLLVVVGTVVLSFDALLIRASGISGIRAAFYRGSFTFLATFFLLLITNKRRAFVVLLSGGRPMIASGIMWGCSGVGFTLGVQTAGAANTLIFIALAPLFSALFSALVYRVKPTMTTILATIISMFGIWFMYRKGFRGIDFKGFVFVIIAPLFLGSNLSFMRAHSKMARIPLVMIGGITGSLISLIISRGELHIPMTGILPLAVLGLFVIPFAQTMISVGTRYISAPEAALINSSETVFGIFYVWVFLNEKPELDFLIGGSIVVLAITLNSLYQAK